MKSLWRGAGVALVFVLLVFLVLTLFARLNKAVVKVDLNGRVSGTTTQPSLPAESSALPPLRLAISGLMTPAETLRGYGDFIAYLEEKLGRPVKLVQRGSQAQVNALMQGRQVDMALLCPLPYVQGQRAFGMELVAAVVHRGRVDHYSQLIVPKGSTINSLSQLRGKTFAFSDPDSCTGWLAPAYQLALTEETPGGFFGQQVFTYTHENNARLVASKLVDGAVIDSLAREYLESVRSDLMAKIQVVERWGPLPSPPMVVRPDLPQDLKAQLKQILLTMDEDRQGQVVLSKLQMDGFLAIDDRAYNIVREMEIQVRALANKGR